jgi:hypothetical protein
LAHEAGGFTPSWPRFGNRACPRFGNRGGILVGVSPIAKPIPTLFFGNGACKGAALLLDRTAVLPRHESREWPACGHAGKAGRSGRNATQPHPNPDCAALYPGC